MSEHDFEPVRGLPEQLPAGERMLWQGSPAWWPLAQRTFHVRTIALYFAALMIWRGGAASLDGAGVGASLLAALQLAPIALAGVGVLCVLAVLTARTSVYTITDKRIVLRVGVALSKAVNIPFAIVDNAALKTFSDGTGDLALTLSAPNKVSYLLLWPHVRPWRLSRPEPALRAVREASDVAALLTDALRAWHPLDSPPAAQAKDRTAALTPA